MGEVKTEESPKAALSFETLAKLSAMGPCCGYCGKRPVRWQVYVREVVACWDCADRHRPRGRG